MLQQKLEDDKAVESLRTVAARQTKGRTRQSDIEPTRLRLRQQLDAADTEAQAAASATEAHGQEVAVAEQAARALGASRHQRQSRSPSARRS